MPDCVLSGLGLSDQAKLDRQGRIGGSDANCIMLASPKEVEHRIREKRGEVPPADLSDVLPVMMGSFTEPLNIAWYTKKTGRAVWGMQKIVVHDTIPYMAQTVDGLTTTWSGEPALFEAKHTNERGTIEACIEKYYPQLQHGMIVNKLNWAVISVLFGNREWRHEEIPYDSAYCKILLEREAIFWDCVTTGKRWPDLPPPPDPELPARIKASTPMDMAGNNFWADLAFELNVTQSMTDRNDTVREKIKALSKSGDLFPEDRKEAYGHGMRIKRSSKGAITIELHPESQFDAPKPKRATTPNPDEELTY